MRPESRYRYAFHEDGQAGTLKLRVLGSTFRVLGLLTPDHWPLFTDYWLFIPPTKERRYSPLRDCKCPCQRTQ